MENLIHRAQRVRYSAFRLFTALTFCLNLGMDLAIAQDVTFDRTRWEMAVSQGHTAINGRQFQYAIDRLNEALAYGPKGADLVTTHFLLGQSWFALSDNEKGVEHYKSIIDALIEADMKQDERFGDLMTAVAGTIGPRGLDKELAEISEHAVAAGQPSPNWIMNATDLSLNLIESNAILPKKIGAFRRTGFQLLGRDWSDIAIHYMTDKGEEEPRLSLYISHFPMTEVSEHYANTQTAIRIASPGSLKPIEENAAFRPADRDDLSGSYGRFRIKFAGRKTGTEILIFSINGWHFKLRATYPWKRRDAIGKDVKDFINEFPWPKPVAIALALPDGGKTICTEEPDTRKFYGTHRSLEAVFTLTLGYAAKDRAALPSPANSPEAFCLKDRFLVGDQVVSAYWASEPQGDEGVYYRFEIADSASFAQVAISKDLAVLSGLNKIKFKGLPVHIDFYGAESVSLMGLFDGLPPYPLIRQAVAESIRDRSQALAKVGYSAGDKEVQIQINRNSVQSLDSEE